MGITPLPNPPGVQGIDWDRQTVTIQNGAIANITGTNISAPTGSGNTSSVILMVDGVEASKSGGAQAIASCGFPLKGDGTHDIVLICGNSNANAQSCILSVKTDNPIVIG